MKAMLLSVLSATALIFAAPSHSQDDNAAAERARLANERIRIEAERRAEEDERSAPSETQAGPRSQPPAARPAPAAAAAGSRRSPVAADDGKDTGVPSEDSVSRMLEQIRTLGELHEAGYVTDDEFSRIKGKILDSQP